MQRKPSDIGQVEVSAGILGGKPVVAGTRISVELILEFLAHDWNFDQILTTYPTLKKEDIKAVVSFATDRVKREKLHFIPIRQEAQRVEVAV